MGIEALAKDHLGGAATDIDHQPAVVRLRQQVGHALIDQPRFFAASNDINRKTQNAMRPFQKYIAVACFTQCLRGYRADLAFLETGQPFAKTRQAVPAALHRFGRQVAVRVQAIALADGFLQVFGAVDLAVFEATNFKAKAV